MGEVGRGGLVVKVKRAHCVLDLLSLLFEVGSKEVFPDFCCTHWDVLVAPQFVFCIGIFSRDTETREHLLFKRALFCTFEKH